jgi:hypothetical protein
MQAVGMVNDHLLSCHRYPALSTPILRQPPSPATRPAPRCK